MFLESKKGLDTLTSSKDLKDFEYFELITGHSWKKYQKEFEQKNRVDFYLLKNIEEARSVLTNPELGNLHPKVANSLLGRVIFIRYLIDRNVELNKYHIKGKEDFYQILSNHEETYKFFQQVKEDFNGNLFPLKYKINDIEINEDEKVNVNHLSIISSLLRGGKIHSDSNIEPSLFEIYDFSIIPIEFVSNVYEKFIGVDKQADSGAYYTPLFLVDYIQKETVSKYFLDNPNEYNCKVLDPACGSGIFLVETLRQIISQYTKQYPVNVDNEVEYNQYKDKLKSLLQNNIYGIDTVAKKIWKTDGETLTIISDFHVEEFLINHITLNESDKTPIIGVRNVKTHYNAWKGDIMFTFYDSKYGFEEEAWNLCYNEKI